MLHPTTKTYHKILSFCLTLGAMIFIGACASSSTAPEASPATEATSPPAEQETAPAPSPEEPAAAEENPDDTLRLIYWQSPTILNPHLTNVARNWEVSRLTYEPLANFDKDGDPILFLAAEIPSLENGGLAPDGKSVTWKLKEGVRWSDGEPFTAEDVKFTYEFVTNPDVASDSANTYAGVESVEVIDDLTAKVNFKEVTPTWAQTFVGIRGMVLPRHIFVDYNGPNAKDAPANLAPVGTGPYRMVEFATEDIVIIGNDVVETKKIVYEANPFFREPDELYFSRVELQGGGDAEVAARAVLEEGNVDYAWNVQVDVKVLDALVALGKGSVINNPGPYVERIFLNHSDPNRATAEGEFSSLEFEHPFLSDLRVRQALAYAINRDVIAKLYGATERLTNNVITARPTYRTEAKVPDEFDLEKARALLDEAGWVDSDGDGIRDKDGLKMKILFQANTNPLRGKVQEIVKSDLESIGLEVELKIIDAAIFGKRGPTNTNSLWHFYADMQLLFMGDPNPDPGNYLSWWTCQQVPQMTNDWTGLNLQRWCNPEYDELYQKSTTEIDPEKRRQLIIQMSTMLGEEVVTIPLVQRANSSAVSNTLEGVDLTPWDSDVWNIKDWRRK